jgi:L,D-peptidoglycan transpeptidase YkuD (ErfK/YbiS/YcfS/YnhG family)
LSLGGINKALFAIAKTRTPKPSQSFYVLVFLIVINVNALSPRDNKGSAVFMESQISIGV